MMNNETFSGYVAIIGTPNVGKSTLLNRLIGEKIAITSPKPQTTRHRICGIDTVDKQQIIYVDTPGIHQTSKRAINRYMNKVAKNVIHDVDIILFVVDRLYLSEDDLMILEVLKKSSVPIIMVVNKVDKQKDKDALIPALASFNKQATFLAIVPVAAISGKNVDQLQEVIRKHLPPGVFFFPEDQISDRSEKFMLAELVREKLFRETGEEIPYSLTVEIEHFKLEKDIYHISAVIYVERPGQKKIVIGKGGSKLKSTGRKARIDMEKMLDKKVFLQLWVRVKKDWSDNENLLRRLGYDL